MFSVSWSIFQKPDLSSQFEKIQNRNDSEEQHLVETKIWFQEKDMKVITLLYFDIIYTS